MSVVPFEITEENLENLDTTMLSTLGCVDKSDVSSFGLTEKSDVYSFGVVLLEALFARKAIIHLRLWRASVASG